jgi:hypothetical protein
MKFRKIMAILCCLGVPISALSAVPPNFLYDIESTENLTDPEWILEQSFLRASVSQA